MCMHSVYVIASVTALVAIGLVIGAAIGVLCDIQHDGDA